MMAARERVTDENGVAAFRVELTVSLRTVRRPAARRRPVQEDRGIEGRALWRHGPYGIHRYLPFRKQKPSRHGCGTGLPCFSRIY